jgi:hypothetical protein
MKMGTTRSPWRYDAAAGCALRPHNPGCPAIFRYASWAVFPISQVVRLPFDSGLLDQSRDRRDGPIGRMTIYHLRLVPGLWVPDRMAVAAANFIL